MPLIAWNINIIHNKNHIFEVGQHVLEFGQHDGKMYYKIQKKISKNYYGTGPRVIVTLGPTPYSKGLVPCSEDRA